MKLAKIAIIALALLPVVASAKGIQIRNLPGEFILDKNFNAPGGQYKLTLDTDKSLKMENLDFGTTCIGTYNFDEADQLLTLNIPTCGSGSQIKYEISLDGVRLGWLDSNPKVPVRTSSSGSKPAILDYYINKIK